MAHIKGITVTLITSIETGSDRWGNPVYGESETTVENVLVGEPSSSDITDTVTIHGKKLAYTLAIPKDDKNKWENALVKLPAPFEGVYRTIGIPTVGIEKNIPLSWNRKVRIERYE